VAAAYATAGFCYRVKGESLGAGGGVVWYRKALEVLFEGRKVDEACARELARRNQLEGKTVVPSLLVPLYLDLGRTYRDLGQFQDALDSFALGLRVDPQADVFEEMAKTYRAMGDAPRAAVSLLEGITMGASDQVRLAAEVVDLYRQTAPQSCALAGNGLNFECPLVRGQLCEAGRNVVALYRGMHRDADAAATANGAVQSLGCPLEMFR
jgi:tetratricopeptide (TPR) repeat protein